MGLRSNFANKVLNSKLSSVVREKKVFNLDSAQSAGILWESSQKDSFDLLESALKKSGVSITGLCYFPTNKTLIPDNINGFSKKQTKWNVIPDVGLVEDFIHTKFDILIDLTCQKQFPLIYVTALSEANFKIGYAGYSTNYYDLNIEFKEQPETSQLAEQILYYLRRINKTTIE